MIAPASRYLAPTADLVLPSIWRIRTAMPGHSFGVLNSYLIETTGGVVLIDTPWGTPEVISDLERGIRQSGHSPDDVELVLLTHYHEDHAGAAGWLQSGHGARVGIHTLDAVTLRDRLEGGPRFAAELERWLVDAGVDEEGSRFAREQFRELVAYSFPVQIDLPLEDDALIEVGGRRLRAIPTPGHTPGHLAYLDESSHALFTGDHVFDRRRNNATTRPMAVARPLSAYWRSMRRLADLAPALVLPGHDGPIVDLDARIRRLEQVRRTKLDEAVRLATGRTAWEIAPDVARGSTWDRLDGNGRLAAVGELLAYLYEAADDGRVARDDRRPPRWSAQRTATTREDGQ